MKKISLLLIAVFAVGLIVVACRDDVVLEPAPSLVGEYVGTYTYERRQGTDIVTMVQAVKWTFTETSFLMDADTSAELYDPNVCFCKGRGIYVVDDRVRMEPKDPNAVLDDNCSSCNPDYSPQGQFALERPSGGVKLSAIETVEGVQTAKTLLLQPAPTAP